jgi:hypothetical protein
VSFWMECMLIWVDHFSQLLVWSYIFLTTLHSMQISICLIGLDLLTFSSHSFETSEI